jgi:DNA-binding transcriptional LysR family regulator
VNITDGGAFDLNLLVVFDALLTDGSVTHAARRVGLSQPAFSNALGRLRARVGDPLFERTGRGMRPTPRAIAMAQPVRLGLAEFERALSGSRAPEGTRTRTVTIAANSYARCIVLPSVIRALQETAPDVCLDVRPVDTHGELGSRGDGGLVMTETAGASTHLGTDLTLTWLAKVHTDTSPAPSAIVFRDPQVCIVRHRHRAVGRLLTLSVFTHQRHVTVAESEDVALVDRALADIKLCRETATITPDVIMIPWIVAETDLVGTVPRRLAHCFARTLALRVFKPPLSLPDAVLGVSWHDHGEQNPVVMLVKEHVMEAGRHLSRGSRA